jgi:hypothetical protein
VIRSAPVRRLVLCVSFVWLAGSCGTDAVGVSECREIEDARCAAAASCGFPDVEQCQRYYHDHCLHGVPVEDVTAVQVDACVAELERAGRCASEQAAPEVCSEPLRMDVAVTDVCQLVLRPELLTPCAFLSATLAPATLAPATLAPATLAPATLAPATLAPAAPVGDAGAR